MRIADRIGCPFSGELLTKRFGFEGMPLTQAEIARCLNARRVAFRRTLGRTTVACIPVSVALPEGVGPAYPCGPGAISSWVFARRSIHIEAVEQDLQRPGGTNKEVRVYVDGVLEGRSILLGRLSAAVNTFPAIATLGGAVAMMVRPVLWTSLKELVVEIKEDER